MPLVESPTHMDLSGGLVGPIVGKVTRPRQGHKRQDKDYGLRHSAFQLPLPLGEGWGEGLFVPAKGPGDPHPSPLPEGEGIRPEEARLL
jgi:hypothetical protein